MVGLDEYYSIYIGFNCFYIWNLDEWGTIPRPWSKNKVAGEDYRRYQEFASVDIGDCYCWCCNTGFTAFFWVDLDEVNDGTKGKHTIYWR